MAKGSVSNTEYLRMLKNKRKSKDRAEKQIKVVGTSQLNARIDAILKAEFKKAYDGNMVEVLEELILEKLEKDGKLKDKGA